MKRFIWAFVTAGLSVALVAAARVHGQHAREGPASTSRALTGEVGVPRAAAVTFTEHVAPIIFQNCTRCHRPGEAAPFALMTYDDVARRGRLIAAVTRTRFMPPWKAEPGSYHFKRVLAAHGVRVSIPDVSYRLAACNARSKRSSTPRTVAWRPTYARSKMICLHQYNAQHIAPLSVRDFVI